ncbi:MAG TPA: sulfatase-like hydrolase/transferase [Polyangiaceae bacterium]|nr:sulfatase-like hydrolase/transferase [Polyangiaceae bacterium]
MIKSRALIATSQLLCVLLGTGCSASSDPQGELTQGIRASDGDGGERVAEHGGHDDGVGNGRHDGRDHGEDRDAEKRRHGHERAPNILLIVADDLGYSDIHAFGGEIDTPNLDALIADGRILTNHHAGTVSAITRSMLISGTDHHLVGEGTMGPPNDERKGLPGYEGYLNDSSLSVAELLEDAGYHTYIAGKWHLGSGIAGVTGVGKTPDQWGFERSFSLLGGAASNHFTHEAAGSKNFSLDGAYAQPGQPGQKSGYSTDLYTDTLIEFIDHDHGDGKPFFAYAAYTSPHWPLQVPEPWLSKYKGRYDRGYEPIRAARLRRLQQLGLLPAAWTPFPGAPETLTQSPATPNWGTPDAKPISAVHFPEDGYVDYRAGFVDKKWESLSDLEKKAQARYMEVYAGMVSNLDYNVGRLIQHLRDIGEYDRTFIFFQSDNGAEGWPIDSGADPKATDEANASPGTIDALGTDNGKQAAQRLQYGLRWAEVSATPFAQAKGFSGEGGVSVPAFVRVPGGQHGPRTPIRTFTHVSDDTATFLAVAGTAPPTTPAPADIDPTTGVDKNKGKVVYKGRYVYPVTGVSLLPLLGRADLDPARGSTFIDEAYGRGYIVSADGRWKARWTEPPFGPLDGHWELFEIAKDRGETNDVSARHPDVVARLRREWQSKLAAVGGVEPLTPRGYY